MIDAKTVAILTLVVNTHLLLEELRIWKESKRNAILFLNTVIASLPLWYMHITGMEDELVKVISGVSTGLLLSRLLYRLSSG
jgi:hypothetical protein